MNKKLKIGVICSIIVMTILTLYIVKNAKKNSSVGLDSSIVNQRQKEGQTILNNNKVLVVYFSYGGNTQKLAKLVSDKVGGDFIRIETVKNYPEYSKLFDYTKSERDNNERPELKDLNINIEDYDTIFIGYPIWWYTLPMPVFSFLDKYDLSGKTIIPFNTHRGSGDGGTYDTIKSIEPGAKVLKGLPISGDDMNRDQSDKVDNWLKELGLVK
ncbi:flavodoxin [uncultured Parvimonas sp.]|uniref:flavodoxin n=1 Tax=uncultured Parvimonas sp. TaxID=747372 RepID=UPI0028D5B111|nr:flavodoxin [uncultured Parvimonas sp.]